MENSESNNDNLQWDQQVEGEQGGLFKIIATKTKQQKASHNKKHLCVCML